MIIKINLLLLITLFALLGASACGDAGDGDAGNSAENSAGDSIPQSIFHPEQTFTTDSFVAAGWKKSKEYDTSTVPGSTEIWYGFFDQKDIEIRLYETHVSALKDGVPLAQEALLIDPGARIGGVNTVRTGYSAYAVVGNAVMMCELALSSCESLISALDVTGAQ